MEPFKMNEKDTRAFAEYLQSTVRLDALEQMTTVLDQELADSQRMMTDIKTMFDSIATRSEPVDSGLRHEDLSKFLEAGVPKLLMPDMDESTLEVDLDDVIATMKGYTEDLKKNFVLTKPEGRESRKDVTSLGLEQYAQSLDHLGKRLANIKLSKREDINNRNADLEAKLTQLCQDVNMFTQIVEAKTTLSEQNKNWLETQQDSNALYYDKIINKLLAGINEVTYLLQNKN